MIFVGLPASGKTSFYRERFAGTHDHVSKDLMLHARHPEGRQRQLLSESLASGRSIVVDNTNPSAAVRAPIITLAREHGAEEIGYFFETSAGDALRRNRARQGRERVPDIAIFAMRKRLEPPVRAEGFDRLYLVRLRDPEGGFDVTELL